MSNIQLILILCVFAFIGLGVYYVGLYNQVQRHRNIIPEIASNVSVLITKRFHLISRLISIVDSYGLHEKGIAINVASKFGGEADTAHSSKIVERLASLRMDFPELKADGLYNILMGQLVQVETEISNRREQYNAVVRAHNTVISQFPGNILLSPHGFSGIDFITEQQLSGSAPISVNFHN